MEHCTLNIRDGCFLEGANVVKEINQYKDVRYLYLKPVCDKEETEVISELQRHEHRENKCEQQLTFEIIHIYPGDVNGEYHMSHTYLHQEDKVQYYWGIQGTGLLLSADIEDNFYYTEVKKESIHYFSKSTAQRLVNIGQDILSVGVCYCKNSKPESGLIQNPEFFQYRVMKTEAGFKIMHLG